MAVFGRLTGFLDKYLLSYALGVASGPALQPYVQPLANEANRQVHAMPLDPVAAAAAAAEGHWTRDEGASESLNMGVDGRRFDALLETTRNPLAVGELIALWQRDEITDAQLERGLTQSRLKGEWHGPAKALGRELLAGAELAAMVVQNVMPEAQATAYANSLGIEPADFQKLIALNGNPPGAGELLDLWNRGDIAEADVDRGLRQSRLKPEWVNAVKKLAIVLPSVSDLIRFAVRDVFTPATRSRFRLDEGFPTAFATEAKKRGLSDEWARAYWAAHWQLPSPQQGFAMYHRGLISSADLETLLVSLDFMPYFRDKLIQLAYLKPGRIDLRRMLAAGVITEDRVYRGYLDIGYSPEDARTLTEFAKVSSNNTSGEKDLTKAEILALYEARIQTAAVTRNMLLGLGYGDAEVSALMSLADARRARRFLEAAIGRIRTLYVGHRIDRNKAVNELDKLGIAVAGRDDLLELWDIEREANIRPLTAAQILAAAAIGPTLLTWQDAVTRLMQLGYTDADARLLVNVKAKGKVV